MKYLIDFIPREELSLFTKADLKDMSAIILRKVTFNNNKKQVKLELLSKDYITERLSLKIQEAFTKTSLGDIPVKISNSLALSPNQICPAVEKNWDRFIEYLCLHVSAARLWMMGSYFSVTDNRLYVYIRQNGVEFPHKLKCEALAKNFFASLDIICDVIFQEEKVSDNKYDIIEEDRKIVKSILKETNNAKTDSSPVPPNTKYILGGKITADPIEISDIRSEMSDIAVEGEVFDLETRELKNGVLLVSFCITDFSSSLRAVIFLSKDRKALAKRIKNGIWLKIQGPVKTNKYSQEMEIHPKSITLMEKPRRMDKNPEKRVELHLHTKYSSQDALCTPQDLINLAKLWGHKAVAFTDHGVVQSFPEVYRATKDSGIKPIYGLEAYVFDDIAPVIYSPQPKKVKDSSFVIVDIETTGLCFDSDEIIEIGAVKICDGHIVDTYGALVKPQRPIPPNITKLTGITNEMVRSAPSIEVLIPDFLDFLGESVFVAHNAPFDSGFIGRDCKRYGYTFNNPILDTLALSRVVLTDLKNHRLNTVAKRFNINMGHHHRAVDDAKTTADIFLRLLDIKDNIISLEDFNKIHLENKTPPPLRTYHSTILVKNQAGLRRLYELVSISHLKYFYRNPRIPKSLLLSNRDNLIIGSGCQSGELYQSLLQFAPDSRIEELVTFYDFLEIQPIPNNLFLVDNGRVSDRKILEQINKKIYELGKKFNKPVVLTGDVHFLNPRDDIYRKILLTARGFQDADKDSGLYFRSTDEMLAEASYLGDTASKEVVIKNPNMISDQVEDNIKPVPDKLFTPEIQGATDNVVKMTYAQARNLYGENLPDIVSNRIERELDSIVNNGFAVIYYIAHKLVKKSLQDGYLVGSRGSVGSSLVATLCGITEVNPLPPHYQCPQCKNSIFPTGKDAMVGPDLPEKACPKCGAIMQKDGFNIPFEVFMGFEGDKVPDIDLNFSGEYQSRAHKYAEKLFGKDCVYRAGTISTIADRTAYGYAINYTEEMGLEANSAEIKRLSSGIIGVKRTTGQHPGGIMVVPEDMSIIDFTPIQHPADDRKSGIITTHFDYHSISDQLLKLDLLGHEDPTSIKMLEEITGVNALAIPLDDPETMSLFSSLSSLDLDAKSLGTSVGTLGVPEFGTRFVRQMLEDTRPSTFSELVRISGLSHGTDVWLNNAQNLIKNQVATLKDVIATRDDIMTYLISKNISPQIAFNIMERVRRGRQLDDMQENLLKEKGIKTWFIDSCNKIKYLFPKAHAVAYVIMAFRIAYFKVHHPQAFYATYFTSRSDDFDAQLILQGPKAIKDKILDIERRGREVSAKERSLLILLEVVYEMYLRDIAFTPIDLYKSHAKKFKVTSEGILPPISALQGIGVAAARNIDRERKIAPFTSREDLRDRTRISKKVLEILAENGVLSGLPDTDQISLF